MSDALPDNGAPGGPAGQSGTDELAHARALVGQFFAAFARLDAETMISCLHREISFTDPVFPNLRGVQVDEMWRMLIAAMALHRPDFSLSHEIVFMEERKAQIHWQAHYRNTAGRKIHHKALATMTFWDGQIVRHVDGYDFYGWSRQSLGLTGWLLGWHPRCRLAVQAAARKQLLAFMARPAIPGSGGPGQPLS